MRRILIAIMAIIVGVAWFFPLRSETSSEISVALKAPEEINRPTKKRVEPTPSSLPGPRAPEPHSQMEAIRTSISEQATADSPFLDWHSLPLLGSPTTSDPWPGWLCADIDGEIQRSLWIREEAREESGEIHEGSCAEWASRPTNAYNPEWEESSPYES